MLYKEDTTYRDIREKSLNQWLDEMQNHEDLAVRGGVALAKGYIDTLKAEINRLKGENQLKNEYLRKVSKKNG